VHACFWGAVGVRLAPSPAMESACLNEPPRCMFPGACPQVSLRARELYEEAPVKAAFLDFSSAAWESSATSSRAHNCAKPKASSALQEVDPKLCGHMETDLIGDPWEGCEDLAHDEMIEWYRDFLHRKACFEASSTPHSGTRELLKVEHLEDWSDNDGIFATASTATVGSSTSITSKSSENLRTQADSLSTTASLATSSWQITGSTEPSSAPESARASLEVLPDPESAKGADLEFILRSTLAEWDQKASARGSASSFRHPSKSVSQASGSITPSVAEEGSDPSSPRKTSALGAAAAAAAFGSPLPVGKSGLITPCLSTSSLTSRCGSKALVAHGASPVFESSPAKSLFADFPQLSRDSSASLPSRPATQPLMSACSSARSIPCGEYPWSPAGGTGFSPAAATAPALSTPTSEHYAWARDALRRGLETSPDEPEIGEAIQGVGKLEL